MPISYCGAIGVYSIYSTGPIEMSEVEQIDKSDGGEFHPYVWEFAGPPELLESLGEITFVDKSPAVRAVEVGGGNQTTEIDVNITKVIKEMEEKARAENEARERMLIANALNNEAAAIVCFRPAGEDQTPSISEELYAAVSRVRALQLMPANMVDYACGFAVGIGKGGIEMVGGMGDAVVATGKIIYHTGRRSSVASVGLTKSSSSL